jgi:hypothetical protein
VARWRLLLGAGLVAVAGAALMAWLLLSSQAPSGPPSPPLLAGDDEVIQAIHAALDAWARFAVFGDLDVLRGHFHPDGPQYAQLRTEVDSIRQMGDAGPPYRFHVDQATLHEISRRAATVVVDATLSRSGELDRSYYWAIELRHFPDHGWMVWTVSTAEQAVR